MINRLHYLRISLLNSCNLNCFYCRPPQEENEHSHSANFDYFTSSIKLLHSLGVEKIRFTGGEPTLYKKLPDLIRFVKELDSTIYTGITTNAILMNQKVELLAKAGLDSVNLSIDTLQKEKFCRVTGRDRWQDVIDGIKKSIQYIPKVKLNTVIIRNVNDTEVNTLIEFANNLKIDIRFIEFMPTKHKSQNSDEYISGDEIMSRLPYSFTPVKSDESAAARNYTSPDLQINVGFINPVSHSFCSMCNRIRLTSDGHLFGCLFSGTSFNLFEALQNGYENTSSHIRELIRNKTYSGCSINSNSNAHLPSFINIGG